MLGKVSDIFIRAVLAHQSCVSVESAKSEALCKIADNIIEAATIIIDKKQSIKNVELQARRSKFIEEKDNAHNSLKASFKTLKEKYGIIETFYTDTRDDIISANQLIKRAKKMKRVNTPSKASLRGSYKFVFGRS